MEESGTQVMEVLSQEAESMASEDVGGQSSSLHLMARDCDMECTICMETITTGVVLPCQCKLQYCLSCWDKALASSWSQRGQPACPSCRARVRVDFDFEKTCLVFSIATIDMTFEAQAEITQKKLLQFNIQKPRASREEVCTFLQQSQENSDILFSEMRQSAITRIRQQAMPVQLNLLKQYGRANPSMLDIHANPRAFMKAYIQVFMNDIQAFMKAAGVDVGGFLTQSDMISHLTENVDAARISSVWASRACPPPKCVCGSTFRRLSGVERFRMYCNTTSEYLSDDGISQRLPRFRQLICCDICSENVPLHDNFVWMCDNRHSSMVHARSYDICEKCFADAACLQ
jgi:hypothetical protein